MKYRADISGLRAVAVVPVVLYHAGFSAVSGGFVGVDVFFVISGFLITSDIIERTDRGEFSLLDFYHRRVRRIFPALFAMLAACFAMGWFVLPPGEFIGFGNSAIAAAISASNFFFYVNTNYFTEAATSLPLLHTWSLAVEEQFYFLWPLVVILMMRWLRPWAAVIVAALGIISITAAQHWLQSDPPFVFYMLPTRAWELLTGGLIALPAAKAMRPTRTIAELLAASGLALITASLFLLNQDTPFPGLYALAPCIGAALIIAAGFHRDTMVSKALSIKPAAFIGLTSYSLYLWHWPLLVFAGIYRNRELFVSERVAVVLAALLASALSWRFVERPFRRRATGWKWMVPTAGTMAGVCCLSLAIIYSSGFPSRGPDDGPSVQALRAERAKFESSSCLQRGGLIPKTGECILGFGNIAPRVVLWGDSQAAHLASALDEAARTTGVRVRQITKAGCAPFPDMTMLPASPLRADCPAFNASALQSVLADPNITLVILAGRWNAYSGRGGSFLSTDGSWPSQETSNANFTSAIEQTAASLAAHGIKTAVVGPTPEPSIDVLTCLVRADFMKGDAPCSTMPAEMSWQNNRMLADLLPRTVQFIPIVPALCGQQNCPLRSGEDVFYLDAIHLSPASRHILAPIFAKLISSSAMNSAKAGFPGQ
ncbi:MULTISPECIES: acyltransferase family protein [Mesorhizobium]|uniref:acyltransferase family protein n=1 Tax=Mesorhizobium TaxID=68287 RepID=UPI0007ECD15D|nr:MULTISPECIES: acyltransferase family protein [Mesorhizobium]TPJ43686.1 acyltransferase [Mesorhizobium sp. B2-6-6]ARP68113.1 acyltransferase [Mesorhizobium sp. WSM1497]MCA0002960.1 acyltransferase [Mesorhizobium sp. B264B2A]MCA0009246.1 acyltransferase [Mesorhizobium sp. B264B1B]MCA0013953.1 acyltransferase [Mesorhizobium sp. B294B1A1]